MLFDRKNENSPVTVDRIFLFCDYIVGRDGRECFSIGKKKIPGNRLTAFFLCVIISFEGMAADVLRS